MNTEQCITYLGLMGIPVWLERAKPAVRVEPPPPPVAVEAKVDIARAEADQPSPPAEVPASSPAREIPPETMPPTKSRAPSPPIAPTSPAETPLSWSALELQVRACHGCALHRSRSQIVFGEGHREADWMIIGDAPHADEDQQGRPFVGPVGQLLEGMLAALGLTREQAFLATLVKCHPPDGRHPLPRELHCCDAFIRDQIRLVQPRAIIALGAGAAHHLLRMDVPVSTLRGQRHQYPDHEIPLFVTYHPAYLLRKPSEKAKAWEDIKFMLGHGPMNPKK